MILSTCLRVFLLGLWTVVCLGQAPAHAHKPSDSYLTLTARDAGRVDVLWHVALRDLDGELTLDANDDGRLTWGEVRARWSDTLRFVRPHLRLTQDGQVCEPAPELPTNAPALVAHTDGQYAVMAWSQQCPLAQGAAWSGVTLDYRLFALSDPTHRGIVRWRAQFAEDAAPRDLGVVVLGSGRPVHAQAWATSGRTASAVASSVASSVTSPVPSHADPTAALPASDAHDGQASPWAQVQAMVSEGIVHIAAGTDHILFLVSLLLVAVWQRPGAPLVRVPMSGWHARTGARSTAGEVLRLVTSFTVAHSITLGLATLGVLSPPSRWVESVIALSVLLAAIDNLWPLFRAPRWAVVFAFGLVHGFGFAGVMQDLGLPSTGLVWPLLGFNLGVELGQLMLVAVVLPVCFVLRRTAFYRWGVVLPGSVLIGLLAAVWLAERSLDTVILGWSG